MLDLAPIDSTKLGVGGGRSAGLCLEVLVRWVLVAVHLHLADLAFLRRCILCDLDEALAGRRHRTVTHDHDADDDDDEHGDTADDDSDGARRLDGGIHRFLLDVTLDKYNTTLLSAALLRGFAKLQN